MNIKSLKKLVCSVLIFVLLLSTMSALAFGDTQGHWAEERLNEFVDMGVLRGYGGMIMPDGQITRAELIALINRTFEYRLAHDAVTVEFADVSGDDWFFEDVQKAVVAAPGFPPYATGFDDNTFRPASMVTRQEAAVMLYRVMRIANSSDREFADSAEIAEWAAEAVTALVEYNILTGFNDNTFRPTANMTRAEATTLLARARDFILVPRRTPIPVPDPAEILTPIIVPERPAPRPRPVQQEVTGQMVGQPAGLTAQDIFVSEFTLRFNAVADAVSYDIFANGEFLMNSLGNSTVVSGLTSATTYSIQVAARFVNGEISSLSSPVSVTMFDINDPSLDVFHENLRLSFDYLWYEGNLDFDSTGFGIVRDNDIGNLPNRSNIAVVGFTLAALPTAVNQGLITWEEGYKRAYGTLRTFYHFVPHTNGFYQRFIRVSNGIPFQSEVSVIDSALLFSGMIVSAEFFGHGVADFWNDIYDRVDWEWYRRVETNRFYMGYYPTGFSGEWDTPAEQFVMYVLGAGSNTHPVNGDMFYDFMRNEANFGGFRYYRTWENALFHYQFSHAFIDFRNTLDREGVDWFVNSQQATMGHRAYAIANPDGRLSYGPNSWGVTAGMTFEGYRGGMGAYPSGPWNNPRVPYLNNGTIFPHVMVGAVMLVPEYAIAAANYQKERHGERVWGRYGFVESINLDVDYFADYFYGLNKGLEFMATANFLFGDVWRYFMQNENVQRGLEIMEVRQRWEWGQ